MLNSSTHKLMTLESTKPCLIALTFLAVLSTQWYKFNSGLDVCLSLYSMTIPTYDNAVISGCSKKINNQVHEVLAFILLQYRRKARTGHSYT